MLQLELGVKAAVASVIKFSSMWGRHRVNSLGTPPIKAANVASATHRLVVACQLVAALAVGITGLVLRSLNDRSIFDLLSVAPVMLPKPQIGVTRTKDKR